MNTFLFTNNYPILQTVSTSSLTFTREESLDSLSDSLEDCFFIFLLRLGALVGLLLYCLNIMIQR